MPKTFQFKKTPKRKFPPKTTVELKASLKRKFERKGADLNTLPAFLDLEARAKAMRELEQLGQDK